MLSIRLITLGAEDYYLNLAADDYYLNGGEPAGKWVGKGATHLGLTERVVPEVFRKIFRGYHPSSGDAMVKNAGYSDRQSGWDFTFCSPKSVSIVWSQLPSTLRHRIQEFQQQAVEAALRYAEEKLLRCRAGKGGVNFLPAGMVAATFEHGTSRQLQCHLHTHAIIMNLGVPADKNTRAISSKTLFKYKKPLGAYCRAHLAKLLETELGFSLIRKGDSFEIEGVPEELIKLHSKRREEILAYLKKHGQQGAVAAADAALKTRRTKKDVPPRVELFRRWQEFNRKHGFTEASLASLPRPKSRVLEKDLPLALAAAQESIANRCSHFSAKDFLFESLLRAPMRGIDPKAISDAVEAHLATDPNIVILRPLKDEDRYTTRAILKKEARLFKLVNGLRRAPGCPVSNSVLKNTLARHPGLSLDQAEAIRYLTEPGGGLRIVLGKAGTGKTTTLRAAREAWMNEGYRVIGATYTGKAAKVLQAATGIETETIHRWLRDYKRSRMDSVKHHVKQFVRAAQGKRTYRLRKPRPLKIDSDTILVVDEMSIINTRHFTMLSRKVEKGGGTLVMLGDLKQLPPVEGSAPLQSLCQRVKYAELTEIKRQKDEWARQAVELFANGKAGEALRMYADHRLITVRDDRDQALEALVLDWTAVGLTSPEQAAVLVSTNLESETANRLCQEKRLQAGCLNGRDYLEVRYEDEDRGFCYVNRVHVGDRVLFTRNSPRYNVENGAVGTVLALNHLPFHKSIAVKLDDGRRVIVPVTKFPHIRLGYAMTTHKAQGVTLPEVFVLAGGPMQNQPVSYVQVSRAVRNTRLYTHKALVDECLEEVQDSPLARQMAGALDLSLATDLLPDSAHLDSEATPDAEPSPKPATSGSRNGRVRKRRPQARSRRRKRRKTPDLTYGMAQVEAMQRRRRRDELDPLSQDCLASLALCLPLFHSPEVPHDAFATRFIGCYGVDSSTGLDTCTNVPIELIVDAHIAEFALQAEAQRTQEELLRLLEEQIDRQRRQSKATTEEPLSAPSTQPAPWLPPPSYTIPASGSSSSSLLPKPFNLRSWLHEIAGGSSNRFGKNGKNSTGGVPISNVSRSDIPQTARPQVPASGGS